MYSQISKLKPKTSAIQSSAEKPVFPHPDERILKTPCSIPRIKTTQKPRRVSLKTQSVKTDGEIFVDPDDIREQIETTAEWPYSVHGLFAIACNSNRSWGTGIMIGPNIVLTAGHNLYNHKTKTYENLEKMQFLPAVNGQKLPFGIAKVDEYFVSSNYIKNKTEDYGILILKEPIGEKTGYFGLSCLEPEVLGAQMINIYGYPFDKIKGKKNTYEMWGGEGEVSYIDIDINTGQGYINYLINTDEGQSGSGVYYQDEGDFYVCGVHVLGSLFANSATLLTRKIYKQIYQWIQESRLGKDHLKLEQKNLFDIPTDAEYNNASHEIIDSN